MFSCRIVVSKSPSDSHTNALGERVLMQVGPGETTSLLSKLTTKFYAFMLRRLVWMMGVLLNRMLKSTKQHGLSVTMHKTEAIAVTVCGLKEPPKEFKFSDFKPS